MLTGWNRLIPSNCIVCGRSAHLPRSLCPHCEAQLPWIGTHCHGCGLEFAQVTLEDHRCGNCLGTSSTLDACHGLFHYRSPIDKLIPAFKFQAKLHIGSCMGLLLAVAMQTHFQTYGAPDLILPVPLHWRRYLQRGFNQSWELCKIVSRITGIACNNSLVRKQKHTRAQAELNNTKQRAGNLRGAFLLSESVACGNVKTVTIIDDVITTMSTVTALATLLKEHGIQGVEAWCIARTGIR